MVLFSIVVPVYNAGVYLRVCLDSVLAQTYQDYEVILINDGSTDGSPGICEDYMSKDSRFRVFNKDNGGLVSARIAGSNKVNGEYTICLDSDDWLASDYLSIIADRIELDNRPDIVCMGYITARNGDYSMANVPIPTGYYDRARIELELFPLLMRREDDKCFPGSLWAKAYKSVIYKQYQQKQCGLFLKIGEDKACTIACVNFATSVTVLDYCGYYYRINSASITKNKKPFPWNGPELIGKYLEREIDMAQFDFSEQMNRFITHEVAIVAASQFFKNESYRNICREISRELENPYYEKAIKESVYKNNILAIGMKYTLRYRLYFFLYLYNKLFQ